MSLKMFLYIQKFVKKSPKIGRKAPTTAIHFIPNPLLRTYNSVSNVDRPGHQIFKYIFVEANRCVRPVKLPYSLQTFGHNIARD